MEQLSGPRLCDQNPHCRSIPPSTQICPTEVLPPLQEILHGQGLALSPLLLPMREWSRMRSEWEINLILHLILEKNLLQESPVVNC